MKAIAVTDKNLAIGKDNALLFRLPGDLAHFKAETLGGLVIMGRKTLESMPGGKPLPGRHTAVLSKSMEPGIWVREKNGKRWIFAVFGDAARLMDFMGERGEGGRSISVCGGEQIYRLMLPHCDELVLTEVDAEAEAPDSFFPDFRAGGEWTLRSSEGPFSEAGLSYRINRYGRTGAPEF